MVNVKRISSLRFWILAVSFGLAIVFVYFRLILKSPECSFSNQDAKNNSFYAKIKDQEIDIIGWYHGTEGRDIAQLAMADAFNNANQRNCKLAQKRIEAALSKLSVQKTESLRVLSVLNEIYKKRNFKKLGVEYGPEQYKQEFINSETKQDLSIAFISMFKNLCPDQIKQFTELYLIFPGPEFKFVLDHKEIIEIVPLGNDELIKQSFSVYSNDSRKMPQQIDQLSLASRREYNRFTELLKDGKPLSQSMIDELAMNLAEPEKSKLKRYFSEVSKVVSLIESRNIAFIDEIFKAKSNIAVVIGNFHVPGFRKILEYRCEMRRN